MSEEHSKRTLVSDLSGLWGEAAEGISTLWYLTWKCYHQLAGKCDYESVIFKPCAYLSFQEKNEIVVIGLRPFFFPLHSACTSRTGI